MKLNIVTILIFTLAAISGRGNNFYPGNKAVSQIKKSLKAKEVEIVDEIIVADELRDENAITILRFTSDGDPEIKYAVFREARGRYDKFDYLLIVGPELKVIHTRIVKYRSEHGGEIASKKWLRQFTGYSEGELHYKTDISAISGATISAMSITRDIPVVMDILRESIQQQ